MSSNSFHYVIAGQCHRTSSRTASITTSRGNVIEQHSRVRRHRARGARRLHDVKSAPTCRAPLGVHQRVSHAWRRDNAHSRDGSSLATRRGASKPHRPRRNAAPQSACRLCEYCSRANDLLQTTPRGPRCSPSRTAASSTMSRGCLPNGGRGEDVFGGEQVDEAHRGLLLRQTSYQNSSCHHRTKTRRQAPSFPGTSCLGGGEGEDC